MRWIQTKLVKRALLMGFDSALFALCELPPGKVNNADVIGLCQRWRVVTLAAQHRLKHLLRRLRLIFNLDAPNPNAGVF